MDLNFQLFETATLFITVLVVAFMLQVSTSLIKETKYTIFMKGSVVRVETVVYGRDQKVPTMFSNMDQKSEINSSYVD